MEKKAKREKRLLEKRAKKQAKSGFVKEKNNEDSNAIPISETITLEHLTRNNTKKK